MRLVAALVLVLLLGCKKSEDPFQNYLRMTVDGTSVECDKNIKASATTGLAIEKLDISGYWSNSSIGAGSIEIELYDFNKTTGEKKLLSPSQVIFRLTHTAGGALFEDTYYGPGSVNKLTITEVSEKFVKGAFQFEVKMNTGPNTFLTKMISGEFDIARNH
jgi:hypothetical protein